MADIKIKDMGEALQIDNNAEFPYTQDNGGQNTTFKAKITQIASKILEAIDFSSLNTTQKKVIPAINEVNSNIPANGDFSLSGLSDTAITSPSANQVLKYESGKWKNKSVATTISVSKGSSMPSGFPTPNVSRRDNVCIVNFAIQIPAGTYTSDDTLWNITPVPTTNTRCIVSFSANPNKFININLLTSGKIAFNGTQTVESDAWLIGQCVYLTDG